MTFFQMGNAVDAAKLQNKRQGLTKGLAILPKHLLINLRFGELAALILSR